MEIRKLMWDMEKLFQTLPATKPMEEIRLGEGMESFKFQSAPYGDKESTWVFAAMGVPGTKKPAEGYPAIVLVHGGGGFVFKEWMQYWMDRGFVTIAVDMFGNQLNEALEKVGNPESGPKEHDGSNYDGVEAPTQSWVYHSIYNVILAHNILRASKDVDKDRIVLTGISWGGYITSILSGVDHRFAAFAPMYGCGFVYEDGFWTNGYGTFGGADKEKWIALYDPSSYLPFATKSMLFVSGIDDGFFSAVNRMRSAALVKGSAFYSQRTNLPHGHCWALTPEINAFFQYILYGKNTYTKLNSAVVNDGVAIVQANSGLYPKANFVYTISQEEDSHKWEWKTIPLTLKDGGYACKIPENTTAFSFELVSDCKDGEEFIRQSTPVYINKEGVR